jgi:hypothetical protein
MKWQTNPELGPFINHWGCFFCSTLEKVEKATGYTLHFSNENIVGIYVEGMRQGWITKEEFKNNMPVNGCFVIDAPAIFNYAARIIGVNVRCTKYSGRVSAKYLPKAGEEEILCLARKGYDGFHFVAGTGKECIPWQGEIEFDPIEGGSKCAQLGWIDSKRILTVEVA